MTIKELKLLYVYPDYILRHSEGKKEVHLYIERLSDGMNIKHECVSKNILTEEQKEHERNEFVNSVIKKIPLKQDHLWTN